MLTTKYEQIAKLEHLICPKEGDTNPLVPLSFESVGARAHAAPFSYALLKLDR